MTCPPCNNDCNQGRACPAMICKVKHKYPSFELAEMVTSRKQGAKSVAYKCDHCAYFHIKDAEPSKTRLVRSK